MFAEVSTLTALKSVSLEKADRSLIHITSPRHSYHVRHNIFKLILTMNGLTSSYPKTTFPPEIKLCKCFSRQLKPTPCFSFISARCEKTAYLHTLSLRKEAGYHEGGDFANITAVLDTRCNTEISCF